MERWIKMKALKDERIIFNNIPTIIQKKMNEDDNFREVQFEKLGFIEYKKVKEVVLMFETILKYELEQIRLNDTEENIICTIDTIFKNYNSIFGNFKK